MDVNIVFAAMDRLHRDYCSSRDRPYAVRSDDMPDEQYLRDLHTVLPELQNFVATMKYALYNFHSGTLFSDDEESIATTRTLYRDRYRDTPEISARRR